MRRDGGEKHKVRSERVGEWRSIQSASSIGANYHEVNRSESRDDFVHKVGIAVKEANESCYWFKVLKGLCGSTEKLEVLSKETKELRNLLQSILKSARSH